ncbi:hypothetical protein OQA88_5147 [Cercophora sp. LCS_1]
MGSFAITESLLNIVERSPHEDWSKESNLERLSPDSGHQNLQRALLEDISHGSLMQRTLDILAVALKPLTLDSLAAAVGGSPGTGNEAKDIIHEGVRNLTLNLDANNKVTLSCPRISDLVLEAVRNSKLEPSDPSERGQQPIDPYEAGYGIQRLHGLLGKSCILFLLGSETGKTLEPGFLEYAATTWMEHIEKSGMDQNHDDLMVASYIGMWGAVGKFLDDTKNNVNGVTKIGRTALHFACMKGHLKVAQTLVATSAKIELRDHKGSTALYYAAKHNWRFVVEWLISVGAVSHTQTKKGRTPLHIAAYHANYGVAKALLGHPDVIASIDAQEHKGFTPLHLAVQREARDTVRVLVSSGATLNIQDKKGQTPLHFAALSGRSTMIGILTGTDTPNSDPIENAEMVNVQDNEGITALHRVAQRCYHLVVSTLLAAGAWLDSRDNKGNTPLHLAAVNGRVQITKALLEPPAGSKLALNMQNKEGVTALHLAAEKGYDSTTRHLLSAGPDINLQDTKGATALHYAVRARQNALVHSLITAKADINARDKEGRTALHYAVIDGNQIVTQVLLQGCPNLDIRDIDSWKPLDFAKAKSRLEGDAEKQKARNAVVSLLAEATTTPTLSDCLQPRTQEVDKLFDLTERLIRGGTPERPEYDDYSVHAYLRRDLSQELQDRSGNKAGGFTWFHIPANNMIWVEVLMKQCLGQGNERIRSDILSKALWAEGQRQSSQKEGRYHARSMKPQFCSIPVTQPIYPTKNTLGVPKTEDGRGKNTAQFENTGESEDSADSRELPYLHWETMDHINSMAEFIKDRCTLPKDGPCDKNKLLLHHYLQPTEDLMRPLHNRRTFDQYCYGNLEDTSRRDRDQVIGRAFDRRLQVKLTREGEKRVLMVDQLWLWVLPNDQEDITDVYRKVQRKICNVEKPHDLFQLIIDECLSVSRNLCNLEDMESTNVLEIFNNEIGRITPRGQSIDMVNFTEETGLLRQIKDIRDELHIKGSSSQGLLLEAETMDKQAEATTVALHSLIGFKQSFAHVLEARWARKMSEETSRQGSILMVFTVVTTIFLPLSFMAAVFSVDIAQFPRTDAGMELSFVTKYMLTPLLVIAFNVQKLSPMGGSLTTHVKSLAVLTPKPKDPPAGDVESRGSTDQKKQDLLAQPKRDITPAYSHATESINVSRLFLFFLIVPVRETKFSFKLLSTLMASYI